MTALAVDTCTATSAAAAAAAVCCVVSLLRSLGWNGGGLGLNGEGMQTPIATIVKFDKKGIGA